MGGSLELEFSRPRGPWKFREVVEIIRMDMFNEVNERTNSSKEYYKSPNDTRSLTLMYLGKLQRI